MSQYLRLQIAYFLQFAIWGSFGFALTGYAAGTLRWETIGWLGAAVPLGAFVGPLVFGQIADRYFSAQKVLAALHVLCGILLFIAASITSDMLIYTMVLMGIFYMPTVALLNSVVFKNIPDPNKAPYVFVFGTAGWIVIVLVIQAFFGGGLDNQFFYVGAVCCFLLAAYSLTLPDTPPQPKQVGKDAATGGGVAALLKQPGVPIFLACVLLAGIAACGFFFTICVPMLAQRGFPAPLALTTINQFSELFFMAAMPFCIAKFGLKKVILIGMAAWFLRYICWMDEGFTLALIGLVLHGMCYSFLYSASYMYGEKIAPPEMKSTVQGVITFLLLGVGQVLGAMWLADSLMGQNKAPLNTETRMIVVLKENLKGTPIIAETAAPAESKTTVEITEVQPAGQPAGDVVVTVISETPEVNVTETIEVIQLPLDDPAEAEDPLVIQPRIIIEEEEEANMGFIPEELELTPALPEATVPAVPDVDEIVIPTESTSAIEVVAAQTLFTNAVEKTELATATTYVPKTSTWKDALKTLPPWNDPKQENSAWKYLNLKETLLGEDEKKARPDDAKPEGKHLGVDLANKDGVVTYAEIQAFPEEGLVYNGHLQTRKTLTEIFKEIHAVSNNLKVEDVKPEDIKVTRTQYLKAQATDWSKMFTLPVIMLVAAFLVFLALGKEPTAA